MRSVLLLACAALAEAAKDYTQAFAAWKAEYGKAYPSAAAEVKAFKTFAEHEDKITLHNARQDVSYWLGHNEFSDLTTDEFFATHLGYNASLATGRKRNTAAHVSVPVEQLEAAVDWVGAGAVTGIKNQGTCGSCWSFSTTGAIEGALKIATGKLVSLSEEDLVQCDTVDNGCQGGLMDNGFDFVQKHGIAAESAYPYTSGTGIRGLCNTSGEAATVAHISGHADVPAGDEASLLAAVAKGPVSVAIEADKGAFQHYKSGVLDSLFCGTKLDHGVLAVGYGTESGLFSKKDYWKVKNSWGASWGESGFVRMVRGKNMCGIASQASYPTGASLAASAK